MIRWFLRLSLHLRMAIILAPLLGILGFGLADFWVAHDQPISAEQKVTVRQLELSGACVLDAASCLLSLDDMNVMLRSTTASTADLVRIDIGVSGHVRGLKIALVQGGREEQLAAQPTAQTDRWYVEFPRKQLIQSVFTVRLALAQTKRVYLAEFPARFN